MRYTVTSNVRPVFLCFRDRRSWGHIVFVLSVILWFCKSVKFCMQVWNSVILSETLLLLQSFEQWVLELWYFTRVFLVTRPFNGNQHYWPVTLEFGLIFENFNLANNVHFNFSYFTSVFLCWYKTFWPWHLIFLKKTIIHNKIIKIRSSNCTWAFLVTRSLYSVLVSRHICPSIFHIHYIFHISYLKLAIIWSICVSQIHPVSCRFLIFHSPVTLRQEALSPTLRSLRVWLCRDQRRVAIVFYSQFILKFINIYCTIQIYC